MTESEFLERIDQHLARSNEHMRRGNEIMADHREFIREITVRQERVTDQLVRRIETGTNELLAGRHVLEDISLATRQHTEALARVLDRMD